MKDELFLVQTVYADYRTSLFESLKVATRNRLKLVSGDAFFTETITTPLSNRNLRIAANNIFLFDRKLLFQTLPWGRLMGASVVVVEFNPRIISSVCLLALRRLLGRPSIAWGHAESRGGPQTWTNLVRRTLRSLANVLIAYTETDGMRLRNYHLLQAYWYRTIVDVTIRQLGGQLPAGNAPTPRADVRGIGMP